MRISLRTTVAALIIGATTLAAVAPADAQWRGRRHHNNGGAVLGGLAAGAILGGIIASQQRPYYYGDGYAPRYYGGYAPAPGYYGGGGDDQDAYCFSRFKSYDPASGTYLGYDGLRHPCP